MSVRPRIRSLTGTTQVTSINADPSLIASQITLVAAAVGASVKQGNNLKMPYDWTASLAGDSITFTCDGTNWYEVARSNLGPTWTMLADRGARVNGLTTSAVVASFDQAVAASNASAAQGAFWIDPADYPTGTKLRLKGRVFVNATTLGVSTTIALAAATVAGAANAVTVSVGATLTSVTIADPGASSIGVATGSEVAMPGSAGLYVVTIVGSGTSTANAAAIVRSRVEFRQP